MASIQIINAAEGNLKHITLAVPKNKLVVFTGLSGSGKSTLLIDVLFQECQRLYLEAMGMEGIHKPKVDCIRGASPAVAITQTNANTNPRSTVGTLTDIYTDLRMLYEKLGVRSCPHCGKLISSADCKEATEKVRDDFHVSMYCNRCGTKMDKLTRTHFSFNTKEGACPSCEGLGRMHPVDREAVLHEALSLEAGAVDYWEKQYGKYQISVLYAAFRHYGIAVPAHVPIREWSALQKAILWEGAACDLVRHSFPGHTPPQTAASGKFEGVFPILWRRFTGKDGRQTSLQKYFSTVLCPACGGERLGQASRSVTVQGTRLPELSQYSLEKLADWIVRLESSLSASHAVLVEAYLADLKTKLARFINVGLGYLSTDRQIVTLSGGELQRSRLAALLDSALSGVIYILDEPTAGLHPRDTAGLAAILRRLRDLGNSVLVVEHDEDIMAAADYLVDVGPGSGRSGGEITAAGTLEEIRQTETSVTGAYLRLPHPGKSVFRKPAGMVHIQSADLFNLKQVSVDLPTGCLTTVTGPSGSGKSTLVFEVLAKNRQRGQHNLVAGMEQFARVVEIGQAPLTRMKRSNVATYSGVYSLIRTVFAKTEAAGQAGLTAKHFSFNSPGGRCEHCEGLGYLENQMLFFTNTQIVCPACGGRQFSDAVLAVTYQGLTIHDVLQLSVEEAVGFFREQPRISRILTLLEEAGLGYPALGQTLTTLSGGEGQRLKLAKELLEGVSGLRTLYLLDEPTVGLHPKDIEHFLALLDRMVEAGNTVVVVEHNQQVIRNSDWVIDLGPGGGEQGGSVIFTGTPSALKECSQSATAQYL